MKRILSVFLAAILLISMCTFTVSAEESVKVYLDGVRLSFDVPPQIINGRTMVPLRKIFESLGASVAWDEPTQSVTATKGSIKVYMQINNTQITVNDKTITLDVPPMLVDSRTLVPARAVAESFNAKVDWIEATQSVIITTNKENIILGTVKDNVYENAFIGIGASFDNGWIFKNEEEMREINNIALDAIGDEYSEIINSAEILQDMIVSNNFTGASANINLEKISSKDLLNFDVVATLTAVQPMMKEVYENMGINTLSSEIKKVTIDGKEVDALCFVFEVSGIYLYQTSIILVCDGYIANLSFGALTVEDHDNILSSFYWL